KHGFLRFQNWRLYAEEGLAYQPVTIWIYEQMLRIEYKAVTLSEYTIRLQEDLTSLRQVSNPHLSETPFRSLQLTLIDPDLHERLLYWQMPPHHPTRRKPPFQGAIQLPLIDFPAL